MSICMTKYDKAKYIPQYVQDVIDEWNPVGSRETCNPPPMDTDQDMLLLTMDEDRFCILLEELKCNGWFRQTGEGYDEMMAEFFSFKKEHEDGTLVNFIVTDKKEFYEKFLEASHSCKEKNLLNKKDRITEFEKFLPRKKRLSWSEMYAQKASQQDKVAKLQSKAQFNWNAYTHFFTASAGGGSGSYPPPPPQPVTGTGGSVMLHDSVCYGVDPVVIFEDDLHAPSNTI